jgi:hypothetical protein
VGDGVGISGRLDGSSEGSQGEGLSMSILLPLMTIGMSRYGMDQAR